MTQCSRGSSDRTEFMTLDGRKLDGENEYDRVVKAGPSRYRVNIMICSLCKAVLVMSNGK